METIAAALGIGATAVGQEIRWRRRMRAQAVRQREEAYDRLLAITDLTYSAAQELAELQRDLHWWNGSARLRVLKGTKLDERLFGLMEEIASAMGGIRSRGTPEAVAAAESVLAAVGTPLFDPLVSDEDALEELFRARSAFVDVVRVEGGVGVLSAV